MHGNEGHAGQSCLLVISTALLYSTFCSSCGLACLAGVAASAACLMQTALATGSLGAYVHHGLHATHCQATHLSSESLPEAQHGLWSRAHVQCICLAKHLGQLQGGCTNLLTTQPCPHLAGYQVAQ